MLQVFLSLADTILQDAQTRAAAPKAEQPAEIAFKRLKDNKCNVRCFWPETQDMLWAVLAEHDGLEIRAPRFWVAVATRLLICGAGAVVGYLVRWSPPASI